MEFNFSGTNNFLVYQFGANYHFATINFNSVRFDLENKCKHNTCTYTAVSDRLTLSTAARPPTVCSSGSGTGGDVSLTVGSSELLEAASR